MSETESPPIARIELPTKVLVYLGPSLDADTVRERIPEAIIHPPAKQSDLISDVMELEPTHVLLIDGEFSQNLSVWQKEIVYLLQIPGIQGIYGASSMGALRAADLWAFGMTGCGRIFHWYNEAVITDESEVSVMYHQRPDGSYVTDTVPMVNVRAALAAALDAEAISEEVAEGIFNFATAVHWTQRTKSLMSKLGEGFMSWLSRHDQKKIDAFELVCTFKQLPKRLDIVKPQQESLSLMFSAQFERDRQVKVGQTHLALQHMDAYIMLHDVDYHQKLIDSNNRTCTLLLADMYNVQVSQQEFDTEWAKFCARLNLTTLELHQEWMKQNNINLKEFCRLMVEEVRLRKVHQALGVRYAYRRNSQRLFDYLRSTDSYVYWAKEAALHEERIRKKGDESIAIDMERNPHQMMIAHLAKTGLSIAGTLEGYVEEAGFGSMPELQVALERDALGEEETSHG